MDQKSSQKKFCKKRKYSQAFKLNKNPRKLTWQEKRKLKKKTEEAQPYKQENLMLFSHLFNHYYQWNLKLQSGEWPQFIQTLKTPLPITLRLNPIKRNIESLVQRFKQPNFICQSFQNQENKYQLEENYKHLKFTQLPFYQGGLVFRLPLSKDALKQAQPLKELHKFIHACNDSGLLTRQQIVSMVPPLLLDLKPNQKVFDMCAAPGSKTAQILQFLHFKQKIDKNLLLGDNLIVANDVDYSRANMLTHQLLRFNSPAGVIINHAAQFYPDVKQQSQKKIFKFDRIVCDVPCSSDAVLRKIPQGWQSWTTKNAISLHPLQLAIVCKGLEVLEVGGKISYSTCSLNPMENEAVICELLLRYKGCIEVLDVRDRLNSFRARQGLTQWTVMEDKRDSFKDSDILKNQEYKGEIDEFLSQYQDYLDSPQQERLDGRIKKSMFKPKQQLEKDLKLKQFIETNLKRCVRIMPHDQNTSGFFIAVLQKRVDFEQIQGRESKTFEECCKLVQQIQQNKAKQQCKQSQQSKQEKKEQSEKNQKPLPGMLKSIKQSENELFRVPPEDPDIEYIMSYYGISSDFPIDQLIAQTEDFKKIMIISKGVKKYLNSVCIGTHSRASIRHGKINIVNLGVPIFKKNKNKFGGGQCIFRICQQGVDCLIPFMTKRAVFIDQETEFIRILKTNIEKVLISQLEQSEFKTQISKLSHGCFVIAYKNSNDQIIESLVAHKHIDSFNLMMSHENLDNYLIRYGLK